MKGLIIRNKIVWIPIVVWYAKKCNKTPTRSELATQRHKKKWNDVRNIKWTKINMVTHVIRGQPFYILGEGVALNFTGSYRFSFSNDQIKTFTFIPSKRLKKIETYLHNPWKKKKKKAILEICVELFAISRESILH